MSVRSSWRGSLTTHTKRRSLPGLGSSGSFIALIVVIVGSVTTVTANTIGVVTSFGRYQGTIGSGLHWLAPWSDVEEFGTRIQPLEMQDVPIRFEGNSGGTADVLIEWRIESDNEPAVKRLWSDYRTFEAIQNRVVHSNSRNALNVVMAAYSPSAGVSGGSLREITDKTLTDLKAKLGGTGVTVERVTIRQIDPDAVSQDRINRQVQAQADLDRTVTLQQIATKEAEIAATRATTRTTGTLQQNCLDLVGDWDVTKRGPLPATFNCAFNGEPAPVVVGR